MTLSAAQEAARRLDGKFGAQTHGLPQHGLTGDQQGQVISVGYRVGGWDPDARTVAEILRYEQDELGNDNGVSPELVALLSDVSARKAMWITTERGDAERYAENDEGMSFGAVETFEFPDGALVLTSEDGDGGYLVLDLEKIPADRQALLREAVVSRP